MLLDLAQQNLWITVLVWLVLYISDYALTLLGAQLQAKQAAQISMQGSYELNTYFVQDINQRRVISVRFIAALALTTFLIAMIWLIARLGSFTMLLFELGFGGVILLQLTVHMRHWRNIFTFRHNAQADEIQGQIQFSRRYLFRTSALDLFLFAGLYLVLFLFVGEIFFLGGVMACSALAVRHRLRVPREPLLTPAP
jgi:hypothetical protein